MREGVAAVLFDLDGTLVDSAPDLAGTVNDMRAARDLAPVAYGSLRPHAGSGARGMLDVAFGVAPGQPGFDALRDEFHDHYATRLLRQTQMFAAVADMLQTLDRHALPWGIVTNKAMRFAEPLVRALGLERGGALVAGDTTPHTKPHPAPLLEAARRMGQPADRCIYVGDDRRDMDAGRAAGMGVLAAAWGYLGVEHAPAHWDADQVLLHPAELLQWLELP